MKNSPCIISVRRSQLVHTKKMHTRNAGFPAFFWNVLYFDLRPCYKMFGLFKKKWKTISNGVASQRNENPKRDYRIKYNTNPPSKIYELTNEERKFLDALYDKSIAVSIDPSKYTFTRLSNGTINVDYDFYHNGGFVGKVKLQGKKKYITYMKNLYDVGDISGELEDCISGINYWIGYILNTF